MTDAPTDPTGEEREAQIARDKRRLNKDRTALQKARKARADAGLLTSRPGGGLENITAIRGELARLYGEWADGRIGRDKLEMSLRVLRAIIETHREEAEVARIIAETGQIGAGIMPSGAAGELPGPYVGFRVLPPRQIEATREDGE